MTAQNDRSTTGAMSIFERYLTLWVGLCIVGGIALGKYAPGVATYLDGMAIQVNGAPIVSIPIAVRSCWSCSRTMRPTPSPTS